MPGNPNAATALPPVQQLEDPVLNALVGDLPNDVRVVVNDWLRHPRQMARARCALHGIVAAREAGYELQGFAARGLLHVRGSAGSAVLAPLAFETRAHEGGDLDAQERLRRALDGAVGEHRYILHIRQPLSDDFDPGPVVQAVGLWQHAVRRGEYIGSDAVYQDDGVHIELSLTDVPRGERDAALLLQANPIPGLERMGVVGSILLRLTALHAKVRTVGPLIPLLSAEPAWRLTRGHAEQVLYGTAASVYTTSGPNPTYSADFDSTGALLAETAGEDVAGIWWFEPGQDGELRSWAHENPWCGRRSEAPVFVGKRFAVQPSTSAVHARLAWTAR